MRGQGQLITGVVVGAGAMYLLDPECGARRRSLLQERGAEVGRQLSDRFPAVSALASRGKRPGRDQENPRTRLILGAAGGLMAVQGLRTRGVGGELLTALGTALLARAVNNTAPQPLVELGATGSSAAESAALAEKGASVDSAAAEEEEEVTSHASRARRTTKSTKRRRSRQ